MMSWYFFFQFKKSDKNSDLILWCSLLTISSLIKISSLISVFAVIVVLLVDSLKLFSKKEFKNKIKIFIASFLIFAITFSWYQYAKWLNYINHSGVFLLTYKSFHNKNEFFKMINDSYSLWGRFYYSSYYYWFLSASLIFLIFNFKKIDRFIFVIFISLFFGSACFFLLMLAQFTIHDYYIITLLPVGFFYLLMIADVILKFEKISYVRISGVVVLVFMVFQTTIYSINNQKYRYSNWMFKSEKNYSSYFNLEEHLANIGIKKEDKVVSIYDNSFNNSLYLMNRKGWIIQENTEEKIIQNALNDCKYAILNDTTFFNKNSNFKSYFNNQIDTFNKLKIYKLKN